MKYYCSKCNKNISSKECDYSKKHFEKILCRICQSNFGKSKSDNPIVIYKKPEISQIELINSILRKEYVPEKAINKATLEAKKLFIELKKREVPVKLEQFDGFKHIDLAIPECKINIEIDGKDHASNHKKALTDLKRTYYSFKKGYFTFRIPNVLVNEHLEETANLITHIINTSSEDIDNELKKELNLLLINDRI